VKWIRHISRSLFLAAALTPTAAWAQALDLGELMNKRGAGDDQPDTQRELEEKVSELTEIELRSLERQRALVSDAALKQLGRSIVGKREDLVVLQDLLDEEAFESSDGYELQALGVVFGDVLAMEFGYRWVAFTDELGRSRAAQHPESGSIVFPVTVISRRVERGVEVDVTALFESLAPKPVPKTRRSLPFKPTGPIGTTAPEEPED
jgi:hypothetical protein